VPEAENSSLPRILTLERIKLKITLLLVALTVIDDETKPGPKKSVSGSLLSQLLAYEIVAFCPFGLVPVKLKHNGSG